MNEAIKKKINSILHDFAYTSFLGKFVSFCAGEVRDRENKTGIDTFLLSESMSIKNFDLRTVAYNVSLIGDSFLTFSNATDFTKLPFADDDEVLNDFLKAAVEAHLFAEIKAINKSDSSFAIAVLTAVAYQNTEEGYRAEERVGSILKKRYFNQSAADGRSDQAGAESEDRRADRIEF